MLKQEADRLVRQGELTCQPAITQKLKKISPRTIDAKLTSCKEKGDLKRHYDYKNNPLLYEKIPTKLSADRDRREIGNIQIDLAEHCGQTNRGEYIHTLSAVDVAAGRREGGAQLSRSRQAALLNIKSLAAQFPFPWQEIHPDNDSAFINWQLKQYAEKRGLKFSRSRPYHKNDNCFVEQKNSSHVRRTSGHCRYDSQEELKLINELYAGLRLYKNFFQPVIKLISKERSGGHIKRKYDQPQTPYQRVKKNQNISLEIKNNLRQICLSQNPAALKRNIDQKLKLLKQIYEAKQKIIKAGITKKFNFISPTFLNCPTNAVSPT